MAGDVNNPPTQFAEKVPVGGGFGRAAGGAALLRGTLVFVQKHQVQVALVVQLASPKLAHPQDDQFADLPGAGTTVDHRFPQPIDQLAVLLPSDLTEAGFGDVGQRGGRGFDRLFSQNIPHANAQVLRVAETVQDGFRVFGRSTEVAERSFQFFESRQLAQHQAVHQFVDHPRVADEDPGEVGAGRTQLDVQLQGGRIETEQFPQDALAAQGVADFAQLGQGRVRVGPAGDGFQQGRSDGRQEMPAAAGGEEANFFLGQLHQVAISLLDVDKPISPQHFFDLGRGRFGGQHQVDFRRGRGVVGESVMQEVVQHLSVHLRDPPVIVRKGLAGRGLAVGRIAHADRQSAQLRGVGRQLMRLQIEHDLQAMFQFPQEAVIFRQQRTFLIGEATRRRQAVDGLEGIDVADVLQVAAVEELEELNGEFDVPNAPSTCLDVGVFFAGGPRALFDAAFQRFDARNIRQAQIHAIQPRLELLQKKVAEIEVPGHRSSLDKCLAFPGAAQDVVVVQGLFHAQRQRALSPVGSQAEVDAVSDPQRRIFAQQLHHVPNHQREKIAIGLPPPAIGFPFDIVDEDQVDIAGVIQFHPSQLAHSQGDESRGLAIGTAGYAAVGALFAQRKTEGRIGDGLGQKRDLPGDRFQPLFANQVAISDPQGFPLFKTAQSGRAGTVVVHRANLAPDFLAQRIACHRLAFGDPQQVVTFRVANQQVGEMLAVGKNPQQDLQ